MMGHEIANEAAALRLMQASLFKTRIDQAEAAVNAALAELLASLRPHRPSGAETAAGRVLEQVAALRLMLEGDREIAVR